MSADSFFEDLKKEFLIEVKFMLDQYEEAMLTLEKEGSHTQELAVIFRVAHSIKGGAMAVGFDELSAFAHHVEDLLAILRVNPEQINPEIISLLLESGDVFRQRIEQLSAGSVTEWNVEGLTRSLSVWVNRLEPKTNEESVSGEVQNNNDHTNYELLAELNAKLNNGEIETCAEPLPSAPEAIANIHGEKKEELLNSLIDKNSANIEVERATIVREAPNVIQFSEKKHVESDVKPGNQLKNLKTSKANGNTIKIDIGRIDSVLDIVGELVVLKNQLLHDESIKNSENLRVTTIIDQIDKSVRELYDKTLSIRMTPLKSLFVKIQRIVRDVSLSLDKPVDLVLSGEDTEVERSVFEILGDPLVHLVRNAMDHGIENSEARSKAGKSQTAKLTVSAKQSGGSVIIEISDDGSGINRERVLAKAIQKNLIDVGVDPASLSDEKVFQFLFAPGFSTAEKVSELSGRGVGLDVVKSNIEKVQGKIDIKSSPGLGTTFMLTIPLSTAITDGILIVVDNAKYILPIHSIKELVLATPSDFTTISGMGKVVKIREALVPVIEVDVTIGKINWSNIGLNKFYADDANSIRKSRGEQMLVVIESLYGTTALPVDDILGQAQVVIKPLSNVQQTQHVSGAAILGDGRTVLILDPTALTHLYNIKNIHSNPNLQTGVKEKVS